MERDLRDLERGWNGICWVWDGDGTGFGTGMERDLLDLEREWNGDGTGFAGFGTGMERGFKKRQAYFTTRRSL